MGSSASKDSFPAVALPQEILVNILALLSAEDLLKRCSLVCKYWNHLVSSDVSLWKIFCRENGITVPNISWSVAELQRVAVKNPFGKNLLWNPSGENELDFWNIIANTGDGWVVEKEPIGSDPCSAFGAPSCFATSFGLCSKSQEIDLLSIGVPARILDEEDVKIEVSEWYAARFDSRSWYRLVVTLSDATQTGSKDKPTTYSDQHYADYSSSDEEEEEDGEDRHNTDVNADTFDSGVITIDAGMNWTRISHIFHVEKVRTSKQMKVRYIDFLHSGKDRQFWAGWYGSKMAAACVRVYI